VQSIANYPDMVAASTPRHECACGLAVHLVAGVWRDGGGETVCWNGGAHQGQLRSQP